MFALFASSIVWVAGVSINAPSVLDTGVFALALASAVFVFVSAGTSAGASTGASALLCNTETFPLRAGIEINRAETMKTAAATIVTFDKTEAVPRGEKAELETLLVNKAPASVLPG